MDILGLRAFAVRARRGVFVAAAGVAALLPSAAWAVENGPAPTLTSTTAAGSFSVTKVTVGDWSTPWQFGAVTIWHPTSTAQPYGAIVMVPGWLNYRSHMDWYGQRLASHGFVVMAVDTNSIFDNPSQRANAFLDSLDWLVNSSSVRTRVDRNRVGLLGYSMGGGGAIEAVTRRQTLKAAVALLPWHETKSFTTTVPIAITGGEWDTTAPVADHSERFYQGLNQNEKAYLELNNKNHDMPKETYPKNVTYVLSWMKRWVDSDMRYAQFLCPGPAADQVVIEEYRTTCPY
jgi:dienelactone hydrolase